MPKNCSKTKCSLRLFPLQAVFPPPAPHSSPSTTPKSAAASAPQTHLCPKTVLGARRKPMNPLFQHFRRCVRTAQPPKKEPRDLTDDSEKNYSNHILEGGDLLIKCSEFCRDYKVSPIYFISQLSEHLYAMHERYAPKDKK